MGHNDNNDEQLGIPMPSCTIVDLNIFFPYLNIGKLQKWTMYK